MTPEQAKQYEVCKTRRHEEAPVDRNSAFYTQSMAMQASGGWKTCRWCGAQYQEVQETRQVERQ